MNPLRKARDGAGSAWRKSRDGTRRTASWVKDGAKGVVGKAREGTSRVGGRARERTSGLTGGARDGVSGAWDRIGGPSLVRRARADQRVAIAWLAAGILLLVWIGWTIYVWTENGSAAGLGVLISWPAVLAVAALVASPFVGAGMLVRRHRPAVDGAPAIAGAEVATATEGEAEEKSDEADQPEDDDSDSDESEDEDADEDEGLSDDEDASAEQLDDEDATAEQVDDEDATAEQVAESK